MGSQSPKKAHSSPRKIKNLFEFSKNFEKIYTSGHIIPTQKLPNVLIVRIKAQKSNYIGNTIAKPTQI